jgi:hypothetical protein
MPWSAVYDAERDLVLVVNSGRLSLKDYETEVEEALRIGLRHGCRHYLVDDTALLPNLDALDIYDFPKLYDRFFVDGSVRIAVLFDPQSPVREALEFYETVCRNQGYNVRLFHIVEQAIEWLKG